MTDINKMLKNWLEKLKKFEFRDYEQLPDIDLYMDQVVNYLDKELMLFQINTLTKQITPSMINNYVKGEVITAPEKKKYSKEHLSLILEVYQLKQVLSIAEIKEILDTRYQDKSNIKSTYNFFKEINKEQTTKASNDTIELLNNIDIDDLDELNILAYKLATTANSYITISKKILYLVTHYKNIMKQKQEQEQKELEKKLEQDEKEIKEKLEQDEKEIKKITKKIKKTTKEDD